jgi:hypothetical protein
MGKTIQIGSGAKAVPSSVTKNAAGVTHSTSQSSGSAKQGCSSCGRKK